MYLSRVEIDINNRAKIKDLSHLGAFHNWVEKSFPDEIKAGQRSRHLWRIDKLMGKEYLLVLSEEKPDFDLLTTYGVQGTAMSKAYDSFLDSIQEGQVMQFRLTANPAYSIIRPGKKQGRIVPHVTVEQQRKWLMDRAEKSGFKLLERTSTDSNEPVRTPMFEVVNREWPVLHRKTGHGARLSRVTFEGLLRVTDSDLFKQTLTKGLGREKAFGMGLMTVIPEG